jgi:U3 small nucleolar ribonucleoprotein component
MKFTINIDCTPQEARTFLGLPDIEAFQKSMMEKAQARMEKQIKDLDAEALMKMWMPDGIAGTVKSWKELQENFMAQFSQMASGGSDKKG